VFNSLGQSVLQTTLLTFTKVTAFHTAITSYRLLDSNTLAFKPLASPPETPHAWSRPRLNPCPLMLTKRLDLSLRQEPYNPTATLL
jgi:hypothetical protein